MNSCEKCGASLEENAIICNSCGSPVSQTSEEIKDSTECELTEKMPWKAGSYKEGHTKHDWFKITVTGILAAIFIASIFAIYQSSRPVSWEYKSIEVAPDTLNTRDEYGAFEQNTISINDSELSSLGAQGWELVTSYLELETAYPNFGNRAYVTGIQPNVRPQRLVLIFKRPVKH